MIILIRLATALVLFVFFFVVAYFALSIAGGFIGGFEATFGHPHLADPVEAGRNGGRDFVMHHIVAIALSSLLVASISALALSFSGILPWCRKPGAAPSR